MKWADVLYTVVDGLCRTIDLCCGSRGGWREAIQPPTHPPRPNRHQKISFCNALQQENETFGLILYNPSFICRKQNILRFEFPMDSVTHRQAKTWIPLPEKKSRLGLLLGLWLVSIVRTLPQFTCMPELRLRFQIEAVMLCRVIHARLNLQVICYRFTYCVKTSCDRIVQ